MRRIREYKLFKQAHTLVLGIYETTKEYPEKEKFGIISQMRRAAYSIPANMIEGNVKSEKEFIRFLKISLGSCEELRYYLLLSRDLEYITEKIFNNLDQKALYVVKMIKNLIKKVESSH